MKRTSVHSLISIEWLTLIILVLGVSKILGIFSDYILFSLLPLVIINSNPSKLLNDSTVLLIISFSISYVLFLYVNNLDIGPGFSIYFLFYPLAFYLLGKKIAINYDHNAVLFFIFITFVSYEFQTIRDTLISINTTNIIKTDRVLEITSSIRNATLYGVIASVGLIGIPLIIVPTVSRFEKRLKYAFFILGILSIIVSIHLINRTAIIITLCNFLVLMFIYLIQSRISLKSFVSFTLLLLIIYLVFKSSTDILDAYAERLETSNGTSNTLLSGGGRFSRWGDAIACIYNQPFGGGVFSHNYRFYAHNLWLDVLEISGIIPFFLLIYASIRTSKQLYYIITFKNNKYFFLICFMGLLGSTFFLQSSVEPIMEGEVQYFFLFTLFWGIIKVYYDGFKRMLKNG